MTSVQDEKSGALEGWLHSFLNSIGGDMDCATLSSYLTPLLLDMYPDEEEMLETAIEVLSSYLKPAGCKSRGLSIVEYFKTVLNGDEQPAAIEAAASTDPSATSTAMIDQMRSLIINQQNEKHDTVLKSDVVKVRDPVIQAVMQDYAEQSDEEVLLPEDQELEAVANSKLTNGSEQLSGDESPFIGGDYSELDPEALANASGYGKKEAKAGTSEDALNYLRSTLTSSLPKPAFTTPAPSVPPTDAPFLSLHDRLGSFSLSSFSSSPSQPSFRPTAATAAASQQQPQQPAPKLKVVSKRVAKVAARAEAKEGAKSAASKVGMSSRGLVFSRRDEMDDLLVSDDDDSAAVNGGDFGVVKNLPPPPGNREKVSAKERETRQQAGLEHSLSKEADKQARIEQLKKASQRKLAAQQRCQKQERRR